MFSLGFSHIPSQEIKNFDSESFCQKNVYWSGRIIRFPLELLGSCADIAFQISGIACLALYLFASFVESSLRPHEKVYYSKAFLYVSIFFHELGEITVNSELSYLLQDLNLRDSKEKTFNILRFLYDKKLPQTFQELIKTK